MTPRQVFSSIYVLACERMGTPQELEKVLEDTVREQLLAERDPEELDRRTKESTVELMSWGPPAAKRREG